MDELQALRDELAGLRREVKALKRTRWITPGALGMTLVALVALGVAAPRHQTPTQTTPDHTPNQVAQDITCKSLKIVDSSGKPMIQLFSDKDGGSLAVYGADGKARVWASVANNAGFTDWYDADGKRRASVFIGEKGAEFHLADKTEQIGAILQQGDNGGSFALNGADGNNRVHAGIDNGGGYFDLSDQLGYLRETFYLSDKNTAQFKIFGSDKGVRFLASGETADGQIISYGEDGKAVAQFPAPVKK